MWNDGKKAEHVRSQHDVLGGDLQLRRGTKEAPQHGGGRARGVQVQGGQARHAQQDAVHVSIAQRKFITSQQAEAREAGGGGQRGRQARQRVDGQAQYFQACGCQWQVQVSKLECF